MCLVQWEAGRQQAAARGSCEGGGRGQGCWGGRASQQDENGGCLKGLWTDRSMREEQSSRAWFSGTQADSKRRPGGVLPRRINVLGGGRTG